MTATKKYNGWTNYETWSVNLILTNNELLADELHGRAKIAWQDAEADDILNRSERARFDLAEELKEWIEEELQGDDADRILDNLNGDFSLLAKQLLGAALSEVDWYDLADAALSEQQGYQRRD